MDPGKQRRVVEGRAVGKWVRPVKGVKKGRYCMEHWLLYANSESWDTTSKVNDVRYGDYRIVKKKKKKKMKD